MQYYYIATNGDDDDPGTITEPFRSLEGARDAIRALSSLPEGGVTVYIRGGDYIWLVTVEFTAEDSGEADKPIVYRAFPGEDVTFSSGYDIGGLFYPVAGKPYFYRTCNLDANSLWVDGVRATRARLPATGYYTVAAVDEETQASSFEFSGSDIDGSWANLTEVEIVSLRHWTQSRFQIASVDGQVVTVNGELTNSVSRPGFNWDYDPITSSRYFVENVLEGLTEPGMWYLDKGANRLYYYPREGENVHTMAFLVPLTDQLISITQTEHLEIRDVTIGHCDWTLPSGGEGGYQAAATIQALPAVVLDRAVSCVIDNVTFTGISGYCIHIYGSYNEVTDCILTDLGCGGIRIGSLANYGADDDGVAHHNTIQDNTIHNYGLVYREGVGVFVQKCGHNVIKDNTIFDGAYSGISIGWKWDDEETNCVSNTVEDNEVYDVMQVLNDGGGIYLLGRQPGTIVQRNTFHDIRFIDGEQYFIRGIRAIYFDQGASQITVRHNLVYDCAAAMQMYADDCDGNLFESNLLINCVNRVFEYPNAYSKDSVVRHNVIYQATKPTSTLFYRSSHPGDKSLDEVGDFPPCENFFTTHDSNLYYFVDDTVGTDDLWQLGETTFEPPYPFMVGTRLLTSIGAFADYTFQAGDMLELQGYSIERGSYEIEAKISDDAIRLVADARLANTSAVGFDLPGYTTYDPWNLSVWQGYGYDANSLEADPLLIDYGAGDYRLHVSSPAVALGFDAEWLIYRPGALAVQLGARESIVLDAEVNGSVTLIGAVRRDIDITGTVRGTIAADGAAPASLQFDLKVHT